MHASGIVRGRLPVEAGSVAQRLEVKVKTVVS
jgi:hypothetical protein